MLEFNNVSKSFWTGTRRKIILDRASFRVDVGTSLGILAPNGTGKTTLIKMMAGLEKPDEGEIRRNCKISFPLGFMGGVVSNIRPVKMRATSPNYMILTQIMLRRFVGGFADLRNILTSRLAPILLG